MENELLNLKENEDLQYLETIPENANMEVITSDRFSVAYPALCNTIDALTKVKKDVDGVIKTTAREHYMSEGATHIETKTFKVTFVAGAVTRRFNVARFKKDHPDLYEEYLEESLSSDSIRVKVKEEKK